MANPQQTASIPDHDYNLTALREACGDEDLSDLEEMEFNHIKSLEEHTSIKSPNPKKLKRRNETRQVSIESVLDAINALSKRMDERLDVLENKLETFELRMKANEKATKENKDEVDKLRVQVQSLSKENKELKEKCLESARYRRRWDLKLVGLPEKENENTRETVIGILTRVIPVSVDKLRETVDTVHRLGKKNDAATNKMPRQIIIQFSMRTTRDEVWRRSREARVCKEMNIRFKEDFSKEDREARAKLWPVVEEARRKGRRAILKEGYALIDGKRVEI